MAVIQTQRGTAAALTATNPVIASGQIVYETDTGRFKVGDGTTAWASLSYCAPATHASTHGSAGSDPVTISVSQISDLAAAANAAVRMYLWQTFR
jgi:Major tropism determinant N-terminal domain